MRIMPVVIGVAVLVAIVKCNSPPEDDASTQDAYVEEEGLAEDGWSESARTPMDKAQNVENVLQDSADARAAEIEDGTEDK